MGFSHVVFLSFAIHVLIAIIFRPTNGYLFPIDQRNELKGTPRPIGSIWPRPFSHKESTEFYPIDNVNVNIELLDGEGEPTMRCSFLDFALDHYKNLIRSLNPNGNGQNRTGTGTGAGRGHIQGQDQSHDGPRKMAVAVGPTRLVILMEECTEEYPDTFSPRYESYTIKTGTGAGDELVATITAVSPHGVLRALESLYQMLWVTTSESDDADDTTFSININSTTVQDSPRFGHRGLMLDSSRHYQPERVLVKILTGMMYNKLNVFHWHIIDDQSFAFESRRFPELSAKGAYHKKAVFTPEAVQRIIEAARVRGIRTILEFDTPGHAGGIGKSHQELLTPCYGDGVTPGTPDPARFAAFENLDPTNPKVYEFMRELFTEIVQNVTRDKYVHIGMDEVYPACWESSPEIKKFMVANNYTAIHQVQEHYTTRHVAMVKSLGAKIISWQDPIDDGVELDKDVVIQVWKDWEVLDWGNTYKKILSKGYNVLLSSCWYMNYINYGQSWRKYFECDPYLNGDVPEEHRSQVLGGEAALWAEFIDPTNIVPRIFPFVGAIGSALWDKNIDTSVGRENTDDAMYRLDTFRCSLLGRGIAAQPIYCGYCGAFETDLDFNFN